MALRDSITALVAAAPPDATVPVRWLGELLAADAESSSAAQHDDSGVAIDLTVEQVAALFGRRSDGKMRRAPSTIRTWLARGELEGAYRNHGREWRIPLAAVAALQRSQSKRHAGASGKATATPTPAADLSAWRTHLAAKRAGT